MGSRALLLPVSRFPYIGLSLPVEIASILFHLHICSIQVSRSSTLILNSTVQHEWLLLSLFESMKCSCC